MVKVLVIFILFVVFLSYSIILVSEQMQHDSSCIEAFSAPAASFMESIQPTICQSNQKMHYTVENDTYRLGCYSECSASNSNVAVPVNNCKLLTQSNCEVIITDKCYLDQDFLEATSNANISCDISGYTECGTALTQIQDGSCSDLECYGDATFSGGRYNIQGKVLAIKIPSNKIKEFPNNEKQVGFYFTNHKTWNFNMSICIFKNTNKLTQSITTSIKQNISQKKDNGEEWMVFDDTTGAIDGMVEDENSIEMTILEGGRHGVYFNMINKGNKLKRIWQTDHVTDGQSEDIFTKHSPIYLRVVVNKDDMVFGYLSHGREYNERKGVLFGGLNLKDNDLSNYYVFLKGVEGYDMSVSAPNFV